MAVTKIKAIKATVNKALDYITNPDKTDGKVLVSGFNVEPTYAAFEFKATVELAKQVKGDFTKTGNANNIAYHMIQSFSKFDTITAEEAHEIGKKLADELLQGKHEYVIATHIDKGHVHNHIILNAVSFDDFRKFRTEPYKTAAKIRGISDRLCEEKGLNVLREPKDKGKSYKEWKETKNGTSWKAQIKTEIEKAIIKSNDFEGFMKLMQQAKIEVKEGKHIAFRLDGQQRFARGKTIGERYTKEGIIEAIKNKDKDKDKEQTKDTKGSRRIIGDVKSAKTIPFPLDKRIAFEVRKQQSIETKELANMLLLIRRESITKVGDFDSKIELLKEQSNVIRADIKQLEAKNALYKEAAKYLVTFNKYLPIRQQYDRQNLLTKKAYYSNHESELLAFEHAEKQLEKAGVKTSVNPEKVVELVKQQGDKVAELKKMHKQADAKVEDLRKAKEMTQQIVRKGQDERKQEERRQEAKKQKEREEGR